MTKEIVNISEINHATELLIDQWLTHIQEVSTITPTNPLSLKSAILTAKISGNPINFIAIGCQNWQREKTGRITNEQNQNMFIRPISGKRSQKCASELASLQRSLDSFGVDSVILQSISNVEALAHINHGNMGITISNDDAIVVANESTNELSRLLEEAGAKSVSFNHLEVLKTISGFNNIDSIQRFFCEGDSPNPHVFLKNLYRFDLKILAEHLPSLLQQKPGPIVWLDIQSSSFEAEFLSFRAIAGEVNPNLPIIGPFANSGNWGSKHKGVSSFPTKDSLIRQNLNIRPDLPLEQFQQALWNTKDEKIQTFLGELGISIGQINSKDAKAQAVQILQILQQN